MGFERLEVKEEAVSARGEVRRMVQVWVTAASWHQEGRRPPRGT